MAKVKIAVIGIGHLGSRHLKVYSELKHKVQIVGIYDIKQDRAKKFAEHYGVQLYANHKDLCAKVDAVSICVPTINHFSVAKDFLESGHHVLVEKPITHTVQEAAQLIDLAEQKKCKLQVGHIERFNSAFQGIVKFTKNPLFIECHRLNRFPNRSLDIGVIMDLMIHDIDIILGLVRSEVKEIRAVGVPVLTPLEDIANCRLTFANGCVCNLTASRISDDVTRKIRIFLKDTYISLDYVEQQAYIYRKYGRLISKHALPIEKEEPLKKELESFIDCILKNKRPLISGLEGKEALELALKITKAVWKNPLPI
ncbi:MAG: Gfo/Idh/MocA family oxidoreductase [Candidatus Omnitrophota bacterium]